MPTKRQQTTPAKPRPKPPIRTPQPLDMADARVILAIDMTFAGRHTHAKIAEACKIAARTYENWRRRPEFIAALDAKSASLKASLEHVTFADKARRIHALNDAALIALAELEARPLLTEVRPTREGEITNESFNNTALAEFRGALADIAAELGDRKNVTELSGGLSLTERVSFYMPEPEAPPNE